MSGLDLEVMKLEGEASERLSLSAAVFDRPFNEALVHQVIRARLASARQGSSAQKTRREVRGGGRKPWRQKGTGRARVGSSRNPLWRGGGVTFAARPRDYHQKVNRKMYGGAMRAILSEMLRQERVIVAADWPAQVADPNTGAPRTRLLVALLDARDWRASPLLMVTAQQDLILELAARNLPQVMVCAVARLSPEVLVSCERALFEPAALAAVEEQLQ